MQDPGGLLAALRQARARGETLLAVHYACESFTAVKDRPLAVACLAVTEVDQGGEIAFSVKDVPQTITDPNERELDTLNRFYAYLGEHSDARLIHWNMHTATFGFDAIAQRYRFLAEMAPPYQPSADHLVDLDGLIAELHGNDYARHPKLRNLGALNGRSGRAAVWGADEARKFADGDLGAVTASVAEKTRLIAELAERLTEGTLKTQSSVGTVAFAGSRLDAVEGVLAIGERFRDVERQLLRRHQGRETLRVNDEYDAQDLVHALLKVFFDNVVAESVAPTYAGGSTRIDFVLPQYRLAIELKMTRSSHSDRKIGDELIQDRDRYAQDTNIDHLLCLVFDFEGILANPRGLEQDLSRETSVEGLAVNVRIYDR